MLGNVVIVGASASIGAEIVAAFSSAAERVVCTYRSQRPDLSLPNVAELKLDLLAAADRRDVRRRLADTPGGIDVFVLLAGGIRGKALADYGDEEIDEVLAVNFAGAAKLLRDLLPLFNRGARVLLVSSISGERGSFDPIYAAAKGALIPFAKSLATALGERLTINVVTPGAIEDSAMVRGMAPERIEHHRRACPRGTLLSKADLARILVDLAQPHWGHANGAVIRINGGAYV